MYNLEEVKDKLNEKILVLNCKLEANKILFTTLKNKTYQATGHGVKKVKEVYEKEGYEAYYKANKFYICFEKKLVLEIPLFIEHEKFHFKKSCQYMAGKMKRIQDKLEFYKKLDPAVVHKDYIVAKERYLSIKKILGEQG